LVEAADRLLAVDVGDHNWVMRAAANGAVLKLEHTGLIADRAGGDQGLPFLEFEFLLVLGFPLALVDRKATEDLHVELGLGFTGLGKAKGHQASYSRM
jgi:hypothetical protein